MKETLNFCKFLIKTETEEPVKIYLLAIIVIFYYIFEQLNLNRITERLFSRPTKIDLFDNLNK